MELWGSRTKSTNPLSTAILAKKPCVFVVNASMFGYLTFPVIDWQTNCWRPQAIADQSTTDREFCRKTSWIFLHQHVVHYKTIWKLFRRIVLQSRGWVKDRDFSIKGLVPKQLRFWNWILHPGASRYHIPSGTDVILPQAFGIMVWRAVSSLHHTWAAIIGGVMEPTYWASFVPECCIESGCWK